MKKENVLSFYLIALLLLATFTLSSCVSSQQACAAYVYNDVEKLD